MPDSTLWPQKASTDEPPSTLAGVKSRVETDAAASIEFVRDLLRETIGGGWRVSRFEDGSTSRSFVGAHGPHRRFVKPDTRTDVVERVAALGIAPPVVAAGERDGRSYVIQEWMKGASPERGWFTDELDAWADIVAAYQGDARLREMLGDAELPAEVYADALVRRASTSATPEVARRVQESAPTRSVELVPTHGDPNLTNFLLAGDRAYIVDWDDAALSDPMRDIGQLLWWYVPEDHWPRALARFGLRDDTEARDRLYWWVAAESLDVALRLEAEGNQPAASGFLDDAVAALEHRPNPRGVEPLPA